MTFLALGACVGKLETSPNRGFTAPEGALRGVSYSLPKVRYDVKLGRTLTECPVGLVDGKPTSLKFGVAATATPSIVAGESYTIDYQKLPGWLRTASFEIKHYPNGTLKSVGAGAEDRTGEVLSGIAKTALSIASIVGLSSGPAPVAQATPRMIVRCTTHAEQSIAETLRLDSETRKIVEMLARSEREAERLRAAGAARLIDAAGRRRFLALLGDLHRAEDDLARIKKRQSELTQELGVTDEIVWNGGVTSPEYAKAYSLSPPQRAKLVKLLMIGPPPAAYPEDEAETKRQSLMTACFHDAAHLENCLNQQLALRSGIFLERDLPGCDEEGVDSLECRSEIVSTDPRYQAARDNVPDSGIFVREPIVGRLLFCREVLIAIAKPAVPPADQPTDQQGQGTPTVQRPGEGAVGSARRSTGATGTVGGSLEGTAPERAAPTTVAAGPTEPTCTVAQDEAKIVAGDFPQFGQLRYFPLRVGTFQAREMTLALSETGRLESFSYKSTKAPAQGLATTAADVAGQYEAYREKRETERRDDVKAERAEEVAAIQEEIDRITKLAELKKLQTPPQVDPLKAVRDETVVEEAELALARAKLGRLQTEAALAEYR